MKRIAIPTACALALTASALAGPGHEGGRDREMTRDAVVERVEAHFERVDANSDGYISKSEAEEAKAAMKARMEDRAGDRGRRSAKRRHHGGDMFARADADGDGFVSKREAVAAATERFDALDADGDGTATREEMRARFKAERARRASEG